MICPDCGYAMGAFDAECPRCHGKGIDKPTAAPGVTPPPPATPTSGTPGTTVLPNSALGSASGRAGLPVTNFSEPFNRNPEPYVLSGIAFCGAYFLPWYQLMFVQKVSTSGGNGIEVLAVVGGALAALMMIYDQMQGQNEVPLLLQIRMALSTACLAFAGGELLYTLFLSNVVRLSFGLPIMAVAAAVMVMIDFNQLADEVKLPNFWGVGAVLATVLISSGYRGNEVRQITGAFAGLASAFNGGMMPSQEPKADVDITLNSSRQASSLQAANDPSTTETPEAGKVYLICNITVKFKGGPSKLNVYWNHIELTASNKHVYRSEDIMGEFQNLNLINATLLPDGEATGDVVFEVDSGAQPDKIELED